MSVVLLTLLALLAFANGANDNCKGVATLVGYGAASARRALLWAAVTTAAGAAVSFWFAGGLVRSFSTGLFSSGSIADASLFFAAVLFGAIGWIALATLTGLPVSTTHAITGALVGTGLVVLGNSDLKWGYLGSKFAMPLLLGPLLGLVIVYLAAWPIGYVVARSARRCVCLFDEPVIGRSRMAAAVAADELTVVVDSESACAAAGPAAAVSATSVTNAAHWLSSGLVGFARGWNDTPKIAALALVVLPATQRTMAFAIVVMAMALGGLIAGRRVLRTLAEKVTPLPLSQSLTASFVTAALVGLASWNGLPVSTTHVATGSIVGAGLSNDRTQVRWGKVTEIVLSWLVTVPVAGLLAAIAAIVLR